eukprot:Gb_38776 [translate_table: standard]
MNGGVEILSEPSNPPVYSRSSSKKNMEGLYDSTYPLIPIMERGFEKNSDVVLSAGKKQTNRLRVPIAEKSGAVAKIKVVVHKRPLNKREIDKKEEGIITIEPNYISLIVYETNLKVGLAAYVEKQEFVFDAVLDDQVSKDEVYQVTVEPFLPTIFQ